VRDGRVVGKWSVGSHSGLLGGVLATV